MAWAEEQSYEEMIRALQNFTAQVEEQCTVMENAGKDCVDNMEGDPAAEKSNEKLNGCIQNIRGTFDTVQNIAAALQEELERIREAARKADAAY